MTDTRRETPHFRLYAVPGSFADRNLGLLASRLEGAYGVFADLLAVDASVGQPFDVYLPEALDAGEPVPPAGSIVAAYRGDAPAPELERSLLTMLLERMGRAAPAPPLLLDGLLAITTRRLGGGGAASPRTAPPAPGAPGVPTGGPPRDPPTAGRPPGSVGGPPVAVGGPLGGFPGAGRPGGAHGGPLGAGDAPPPEPPSGVGPPGASGGHLGAGGGPLGEPPSGDGPLGAGGGPPLDPPVGERPAGGVGGLAGGRAGGGGPSGAEGGPLAGGGGPLARPPGGGAPPFGGGPASAGGGPLGAPPGGGGPPFGGGALGTGGGPPGGGGFLGGPSFDGGGRPGGPGGPGGVPVGGPAGGPPPGGRGGPGDPRAALFQAKASKTLPPLGTLLDGPTPATRAIYAAAAVSFVDYLVATSGAQKLQQFVRDLTPADPDPATRAAYQMSFTQLENAWRKTLKAPAAGGVFEFLRSLFPYLRPHWLSVIEIVLEIGVGVAYITYVATVQRSLFDDGILKNDLGVVLRIIATLFVLFIISSLVGLRQNYATARVSQSVLRDIRMRIFSLIQRLDSGFFQRMQTGDILSRVTSDLSMIEFPVGMGLAQGARMVLMLILAVGALLLQSPRFAIVLLLATPLFVLTAKYLGPATARASRQRQQNLGIVTSTIQENIGAQPVVKAFGLEDTAIAQYARQLQTLFQSAIRFSVLTGFTSLAAQSITTAIQLIALGLGAWLVIAGGSTAVGAWLSDDAPLTVGSLPTVLALMAQVVAAMQGMSGLLQMFQQASGPMDRINELLRTRPAIVDAPNAQALGRVSDAIRFENVSFGYNPAQPVVHDVDLVIPAGTTVGLVGPSGCGKSTLLGLLQRFYDPQTGVLRVDDADVRSLTVASLRSQMGVVFQDSILFNLSIRENIRLGKPGATDVEVEEAARQAEMHDMVVAMPDGYDTPVGERGSRLSGGQRQRVAIARAMIRNPAILVLDEATSALDPTTEAAVNATLQRIGRGRTTISVSHRLAGIAHADRIYVLDRGAIVEHGSHQELLELNGLYARLWHEQTAAVAAAGAPLPPDVGRLQAIPLFAGLPSDELIGLTRRLHAERFAAGDVIITQGDDGDKLYLLQQGEVEVVATDPGGERKLATLRQGDYFGEVALLHDVRRTATIRAVHPTLVDTLSKEDFLREMTAVPALRAAVERGAENRMGSTVPVMRKA